MPKRTDISSILIIGAGPIVIGQACEFDYSGTQAVKALKEEGYRIILVNSNPATIMTDPEFADATYIEPITPEVVAKIIEKETAEHPGSWALLPTMGGQTALNTALALFNDGTLEKYGVKMIGADADAIDKAEDRQRFREAMDKIGLESARSGVAHTVEEAFAVLERTGLPSIIRPSFTLGGTGGGVAYNKAEFEHIVRTGLDASPTTEVLIEESLLGWKEYEMEVVRDRNDNCIIICSIENVDPMGVHTGDSITVAPALTLTDKEYQIMRNASIAVLREIGVETGGSNVQFAIKDGEVYLIEVNPRASRTVPFVAKAIGAPIAKIAARVMAGEKLKDLPKINLDIDYIAVKEAVFPFARFPGVDPVLSPEMKSTGEVMGIDQDFAMAFAKAQMGGGTMLPDGGKLFVSVKDSDKSVILPAVKQAVELGFAVCATGGTADYLAKQGISVERVNKVAQGRPHIVDKIKDGEIDLIFNTTEGWQSLKDSESLRRSALMGKIPYFTTASASVAAAQGIGALRSRKLEVRTLQSYHSSSAR